MRILFHEMERLRSEWLPMTPNHKAAELSDLQAERGLSGDAARSNPITRAEITDDLIRTYDMQQLHVRRAHKSGYRSKLRKVVRLCWHCNYPFTCWSRSRQQFCSPSCRPDSIRSAQERIRRYELKLRTARELLQKSLTR